MSEGKSVIALPENQIIETLQSSLYVGAKAESIRLVMSYCAAQKLDPFQKPVHIVPMSVKVGKDSYGKDRYEYRDVIMPGVGLYRIQAARTGEYAGVSEPEFGATITKNLGGENITFPEWCKITVKRLVQGHIAEYTVKEYWLENYATAGKTTVAPNAMWKKRPFGQIAKCTEAQALRKGFPEVGASPTAEEMEGKSIEVIDNDPPAKQLEQKVEFITPEQVEELSTLILESGKFESDILNGFKINSLLEFPQSKFKGTCDRLKEIIEKNKAGTAE